MKKIYNVAMLFAVCAGIAGTSSAKDKSFTMEIENGLGTVVNQYINVPQYVEPCDTQQYVASVVNTTTYDGGYGELGQEVFYDMSNTTKADYEMFIPTTMYLRLGGGLNIPFATTDADVFEHKQPTQGAWNATIGLGWNMSSYVRTELAFQESTFKFKGVSNLHASYHTLNGMLYFDFLRRYVHSGDITYRRVFVPFMGLGVGVGTYNFIGTDGANGLVVAAPRAELGMNFMLNDLIGLDIAYQYQMFIENGFGWDTKNTSVDNISNIMATIRVNF